MIRPKRNLENLYRFPLSEETRQDKLRLEMNENICPLSEEDIEQIRNLLHPSFFNCYPEYHKLYEQLSANLQVDSSALLLTNGSDSASRLMFETFVAEEDNVVLTNPTFAMHGVYAQIAGARVEQIDYSDDFTLDIDTLCQAIQKETKACILVNPNNPTGDLLSLETLHKVADHCASCDTILLIDEAYIDFSGQSFAAQAPKYDNVIVTRTFSKAFGLAALRLGYVVSNAEVAEHLRRTQPIFDVNNFAIECAKYLLARPEILERHHQTLNTGLSWIQDQLQAAGYEVRTGAGNFLLIRTKNNPSLLQEELRKRNILVSAGFSLPFLAPYLRISLGPKEAMELFFNTLLEIDCSEKPLLANELN